MNARENYLQLFATSVLFAFVLFTVTGDDSFSIEWIAKCIGGGIGYFFIGAIFTKLFKNVIAGYISIGIALFVSVLPYIK